MKNFRSILLFILLISLGCMISAQPADVPQGFNFMSVARDGNGDLIKDTQIGVRIAILDATMTTAWEEEHTVTTNGDGLFSLIIGDPGATPVGTGYADDFASVDWTGGTMYVKTSVSLVTDVWIDVGTAQLFSVPYAMVSDYSHEITNSPFVMDNDTIVLMNSVDVLGTYPVEETEALFEVKRQDGKTMFAVYNQGVTINLPLDYIGKGVKGGFSIGGFSGTKEDPVIHNLFTLNKDSARIYLDHTPNLLPKGAKGGFAIGGFGYSKQDDIQDYLFIGSDSARIYVKDELPTKGVKGGFAIGGFGSTKGSSTNFLDITPKNYFIGHETGTKTLEAALYNSVMGYQAAKNLTTGTYNTVIGYLADSSLTSGSNNIIIGASAGRYLTTGQHNTLIGNGAGLNHSSQEYNVMIGTSAGANLLRKTYNNGSFNTFIGINAGYKIKSGKDNTFLGTNAGAMLEAGSGNTIVGIDAGRGGMWDPTVYHTGDSTANNTIIGNGAGYNLAVGHGNVFIGYQAGYNESGTVASPASNKLYISNSSGNTLIYGNFATGRIGLGTLSPAYKLDVVGDINITGDFRVNGSPIAATSLTTGTLTATSPVVLSATREVIGGSAVISIADASTAAKGAVQLSDSYSGTSQTLATTEKALSDGLATKADGTGMIVGEIYSEIYGTLLSAGGFVLAWDVNTDEITITNDNPFDGAYWYTMQAEPAVPTKFFGPLAAEDKLSITGWNSTDFGGFEIHFGQIGAGGTWCSVWLQYFDGKITGHYIIN